MRGDGGKVEIPLFFERKGNLKRKLKQGSAVGLFKSLQTQYTTKVDLLLQILLDPTPKNQKGNFGTFKEAGPFGSAKVFEGDC